MPSLISINTDKEDSKILMHYAFVDPLRGRELVRIQVVGYGGEIGVDGAIQGIGIGLSKMLVEGIVEN